MAAAVVFEVGNGLEIAGVLETLQCARARSGDDFVERRLEIPVEAAVGRREIVGAREALQHLKGRRDRAGRVACTANILGVVKSRALNAEDRRA